MTGGVRLPRSGTHAACRFLTPDTLPAGWVIFAV